MPDTVLVPDLDGDLAREISALEEWAIDLQAAADDGMNLGRLDAAALRGALGAVWTAATAAAAQPHRVLGVDGREYAPLHAVQVDPNDMAVLRAALAAGRAVLDGGADLDAALEQAAERYAAALGTQAIEAAAPLERLDGLLQILTPHPEQAVLQTALDAGAVLSPEAAAAYARLADRVVQAWHADGGPEVRWAIG